MTDVELTMKKEYPPTKDLCPLNDFKPCMKRDCALFNVFEKQCGILGLAGLNTNLWKIHNLLKYSGEKDINAEHRTNP